MGDDAEILAGGDIDKDKLSEKGVYPVIANALTNDGIVGYYEDEFRINAPAVTVTGRGDVGHAQARVVNFTPVVRLLSVKSNHDAYFLENAIHMHRVIVESTGVPQLTTPQLSNYKIWFTSIDEEKKIGALFTNLDRLITLHQREHDKTVNIKKAMLEKMFPKDGEDKPEIRLAGFTDPWEQRKLGDIAEFSKGYGYAKGDLRETGTPVILYGRLYTKFETVISQVDTFACVYENTVFSKGGEVIVPASGETAEDISRASVVENAGIILGGDLNVIKPEPTIDPVFLAVTISNGTQQKELSKRAQGKSVVHIHNSDLRAVMLVYPQLDEQKQIRDLFLHFDALIALHQRELNKLQNMKKALLEKMFV